MPNPRLNALGDLDDAISRQGAALRGLVSQGRLVEFDELSGTGTVRIYGRMGQTALVRSVLALDPGTVAELVSFDVVLLSPNGRVSDLAFILGGASGPSVLYPGLDLPRTTTVTASTTAAGVMVEAWRVRFEPPTDGGALLVTAIEAPVALATPNTRAVLTAFGGGSVSRRYVPRVSPMPNAAYTTTGGPVIFLAEDEPFRQGAAESFQVAFHAERLDESQPAEFLTYTSGESATGGRLTVASGGPVVRLRGRVALKLG